MSVANSYIQKSAGEGGQAVEANLLLLCGLMLNSVYSFWCLCSFRIVSTWIAFWWTKSCFSFTAMLKKKKNNNNNNNSKTDTDSWQNEEATERRAGVFVWFRYLATVNSATRCSDVTRAHGGAARSDLIIMLGEEKIPLHIRYSSIHMLCPVLEVFI